MYSLHNDPAKSQHRWAGRVTPPCVCRAAILSQIHHRREVPAKRHRPRRTLSGRESLTQGSFQQQLQSADSGQLGPRGSMDGRLFRQSTAEGPLLSRASTFLKRLKGAGHAPDNQVSTVCRRTPIHALRLLAGCRL